MKETVKIFVINLKRSEERRNEITKKLNEFSLDFELFEAVDGMQLPDEFMEKIVNRSGWFKEDWEAVHLFRRGEVGASLSHFNIYKKIIRDNLDFAIILEDDVNFDKTFQDFANNRKNVKSLMNKFDLLLLGYCGNDVNFHKPAECSYWGRISIDKLFRAGIPVNWYWSAIGYVISNKGAKLLAEKQGSIPCLTADILTANSPQYGVRLGVMRKQIVWPGELNNFSTIQVEKKHFINPVLNIEQIFITENKTQKLDRKMSSFSNGWLRNRYRIFRANVQNERIKINPKLYQFTIDRY